MYPTAPANVAPTNKHTILETLNYIHIESITNSRTHQTSQLKVATVCFKYTVFSLLYYRQIKSTNDHCRISPGLNSWAERLVDDGGIHFRSRIILGTILGWFLVFYVHIPGCSLNGSGLYPELCI